MMETITDIILAITVLLLTILNIHNRRRIDNLEKWVNVLIYAERRGGDNE